MAESHWSCEYCGREIDAGWPGPAGEYLCDQCHPVLRANARLQTQNATLRAALARIAAAGSVQDAPRDYRVKAVAWARAALTEVADG